MKLASTIARYLLGLIFTVFGANGFLHFIPAVPPATAFGAQFLMVAFASHFMVLIFLLQLVAGISLLVDRFVPLALVVLGAILTNILNYHITMDPGGIGPSLASTVFWILVAQKYRGNFVALFSMNPRAQP
jgi:putative oxidoreductase